MGIGKSVVSHFASKVLGSVAGFVATFVIARILGAEALGVYALAQGLMIWATVPSHGVTTTITKYISEGKREGEFASVGVLFNLLLVLITVVLIISFEKHVNEYVGTDAGMFVLLLICSSVLFGTIGGILKGEKKVAAFGWLTTAEKVLRTIFQVAFILLGYKVSGLIVGHAGSLVIAAIIGIYISGLRPALPGSDEIIKSYNYAKYAWLGSTKKKMFGWMDTIILGFFVSSAFIGIYEVAWTLSSFLILSSNSIRNVLFPEISELSSENKDDKILTYLNEGILYTGLIVIPGLFGASIIGGDLLSIYRPTFAEGATVLQILILAQLANVYGKQFVDILNAIDRPDIAFRVNGSFVFVNISLNLGLIYAIGWHGAAIATLASGAVTLMLGYYYTARLFGAPPIPWRGILSQVVSSVVMAVGVYFVSTVTPSNHYVTVGLAFVGALMYGSVLLVVSPRIREDFLNGVSGVV